MKLLMNGALGRMGRRIITLAANDPTVEIVAAVDVACDNTGQDIGEISGIGNIGVPLSDDLQTAISAADVVIDFSFLDSVPKTASICTETATPFVEGTTGLTGDILATFLDTVKPIPCVFAPNMSVGVNLLFKIAAETAAILGMDYDVEIAEVHHRFKKDSPSGTARRLGEVIAEARDTVLEKEAVYGRQGIVGERTRDEIGIHAIRAGDVVGEHTVTYATLGERIELTHRAHSRDAFASGAIRAAKFAAKAAPGTYDMQDVLGLK